MENQNKHLLRYKRIIILLALDVVFLVFFALDYLFPFNAFKPFSRVIYGKDSALISTTLSPDGYWRLKTKEGEISPMFKNLLLEKEDKYFYQHPGFNLFALLKSLTGNVISGKRNSGASTITMQVVRLCKKRNRNYFSKILEIINAYQLELNYSKEEILTFYLSYVPFGGNVEGVKSASYLFFQKKPKNLSIGEVTGLLLVPNRPNSFNLNNHQHTSLLKSRKNWLNKFLKRKKINSNQFEISIQEPFLPNRKQPENKAPHFSNLLNNLPTLQSEISSTLDVKMQVLIQNILKEHINEQIPLGITNGAVLVVENSTGNIVTYCGSADFTNIQNEGQNDAIQAYRSPGSTLKTFLYANTIEKGELIPKTQLLDIPITRQGFIPENFDRKFRGRVSAEYSLINSLNIPAIMLTDIIPPKDFISFLGTDLEFQHIKENKKNLGVSIVLGGCESNLMELVGNYSIFGNLGIKRPLHFISKNSRKGKNKYRRIYSTETSWVILDMLSKNNRPDLNAQIIEKEGFPKMAWKTGTSFGKKDAWVIGVSKKYTIGIWIGNMNGKSAANLTGAHSATPLLFKIFNSIEKKYSDSWFEKPNLIKEIKLCRYSGRAVSPFCQEFIYGNIIDGVTNNSPCESHQNYHISKNGKFHYCMDCLIEGKSNIKSYLKYEPEYLSWLQMQDLPIQTIPPHNPDCSLVQNNEEITITSPTKGFKYLIEKENHQFIILRASTSTDASYISWYGNQKFLGKFPSNGGVKFYPINGKNIIHCLDSKGRKSSIEIEVQEY